MLSRRSFAPVQEGKSIVPPRQTPAQKLSAKLLLGNDWAAVTTRMGFINLPLDESAHERRMWAQERPVEWAKFLKRRALRFRRHVQLRSTENHGPTRCSSSTRSNPCKPWPIRHKN